MITTVQKKAKNNSIKHTLANIVNKTGLYFSIQIGELPPETFDVVEFTLNEALSELFTLTVVLSSKDANIDLHQQLMQKVQFAVYSNGIKQRTVKGIVETAKRGDSGFKRTYYTFIIRPLLWQLTLTQDSRIYHFKSVPDIIDEILQDFNIPFDKQLEDPHPIREYTTMKRESYYQFLIRLAAEEGIIFWFEEDKLFYSDSHLGMTGGVELIYNPHPQSASSEPVINKLTFSCSMRPTQAKLKDYWYNNPDVSMDAKYQSNKLLPAFEIYDSYGRYDDEKIAKQFSQYRLEALQADSETGQAESNTILLMPGKIFTLTKHPSQSMNTAWQIVTIHHHGTLPQSLDNESDDRPANLTNDFSFISGKSDWRPPFIHKPQADGDEIATVVGPKDEEIYVNEYGAVKIHFHWNRYDKADEHASCWVRVLQNWNGDGYGFLSTPRIGQEVLVGYINGDIDRPIIMGTTYNGKNSPPLALPAAKTQMSIKSKTHKGQGFNELRFEDENGKQDFFMHAQKDMNTVVLNDRSTTVLADHTEDVANDQTITVGNDQSTTIFNDHTLSVKANSKILIGGNHQLQTQGEITISSANKIRLDCGEAAIQLESNGKIALICNSFSFFAKEVGQITGQRIIELNDEKAEAQLKNIPVPDEIEAALKKTFPE